MGGRAAKRRHQVMARNPDGKMRFVLVQQISGLALMGTKKKTTPLF